MIPKNRKIALIVGDNFPQASETFLVRKYERLIESLDITILGKGKGNWSFFPSVKEKLTLKKMPGDRRATLFLTLPFYLFSAFIKAPLKTLALMRIMKGKSLANLINTLFFIKNHYDIIHFEMGSFGMEYQNLIELKDILGSKFIQSFRGSDINFIPLRCGERIYDTIFQKCDYFHFVSRTLLERARQLGYNKNNFTLIPSSADTNYFKPSENRNLKKKNGKVILVSVGRLDWKKGYEYSLQAAKILKEQGFNFSFYIIGDGEYKDAILQTIQDLSLEDCVELLGAQDRDTVKKYLNIADIFVQASLAEGFGNSFLEASAMELPCVVTDAGGCPEGVVNGKTGFVVPKRNPEALAEKIKILIKNPKLRQKMGKLGRKQVIKNYMLDRQVEDNIKMYGKVLSS